MTGARRDLIRLDYTLRFDAPFHLGTGLRRGLAQRAVALDPDGLLYVPGSTVKGVVRERCEQLARLFGLTVVEPHVAGASVDASDGIVDSIFGSRRDKGTVFFDDAPLAEMEEEEFGGRGDENGASHAAERDRRRSLQVEPRTRVSLSRLTGGARHGHLFTGEYGVAGLQFCGTVRGLLCGPELPVDGVASTYQLLLLVAGLLAVERLGSERSSGAGACSLAITALVLNGVALASATSLLDGLEYLELFNDALDDLRSEEERR